MKVLFYLFERKKYMFVYFRKILIQTDQNKRTNQVSIIWICLYVRFIVLRHYQIIYNLSKNIIH